MESIKTTLSKPYQDYLIASLQDPEAAAAYLEAILAEENPEPELLNAALQDLAQALNPNQAAPLPLSIPDSQSVYTLATWLKTLGLKLTVTIDNSNPQ
jgi:hypothetical protein